MIPPKLYRLVPEEETIPRMLLRRMASLLEAPRGPGRAGHAAPATAAADAAFWLAAAMEADRDMAEDEPHRFLH